MVAECVKAQVPMCCPFFAVLAETTMVTFKAAAWRRISHAARKNSLSYENMEKFGLKFRVQT